MDSARCICPKDPSGGRNKECPIHGFTSQYPMLPWLLNDWDRTFLRTMRINPYE